MIGSYPSWDMEELERDYEVHRLWEAADKAIRDLQPSWKTVRLALMPVLRTVVASEVGVLDYSAGLNVGAAWPLWDGAVAEWRVQKEVVRSEDFERTGIFGLRRIRGGTERLAITQSMRLPVERWLAPGDDLKARHWGLAAVTAQATVGRVGGHFDGVHGAMRWEPGEGRHRVEHVRRALRSRADLRAGRQRGGARRLEGPPHR